MTLGGGPHSLLYVPSEGGNDTGRRKDGRGSLSRIFFLLKLPEQIIRFGIVGPRTIGESEVEAGEEKGPAGLATVQSFDSADVFKVFVVSPNQKGFLGAFQPMSPLF